MYDFWDAFGSRETPHNLADNFIKEIFQLGSDSVPLLGQMSAIWCGVILALGAIGIVVQCVARTVHAAAHGKTFRDDISWVSGILKTALGIGSLIPLSNGYPAIVWLFIALLGAFNNITDDIQKPIINSGILNAQPLRISTLSGREIVWQVVESEVCAAVYNGNQKILSQSGTYTSPMPLPPASGEAVEPGFFARTFQGVAAAVSGEEAEQPKNQRWQWGPDGECGTLTFENGNRDADFAAARNALMANLVASVRENVAAYIEDNEAIFTKDPISHSTGEDGASPERWQVIRNRIHNQELPPALAQFLVAEAKKWNAGIEQAARSASAAIGGGSPDDTTGSRQRVATWMSERGWMGLGVSYRFLSQSTGAVVGMATERPVRQAPSIPPGLKRYYDEAMFVLAGAIAIDASNIRPSDLGVVGNTGDSSSRLASLLAPSMQDASAGFMEYFMNNVAGQDSADPIGGVIGFGHYLIDVWYAKMTSDVVGLTAVAEKIPLVGSVVSGINNIANLLMLPLLIVGIFEAFILPALPLIFWLIGIIVWSIIIVEALIALPLLAVIMTRIDSHEFVDRRMQPGLYLFINAFARPAIMSILFACCAILTPALLNLLNALWSLGYTGQQGGNIVGIFMVLVGIVLHFFLITQIFLRTSSMMVTGPGRILAVLGVQSPDYGESAMDSAMVGGAVALGGSIGHAVGHTAQGTPGKEPAEKAAGGKGKGGGADGVARKLDQAGTVAGTVGGPKGKAAGIAMKGAANALRSKK